MILRNKPQKVLILGSGALQIGQAGEFDYSGSQAIKALKEDKIESVLINPNIATIQTSENFADKVYFHPLKLEAVEEIIKKENIDAILLGFGGQTALNLGVQLYDAGIFSKYNIAVLGTNVEVIKETEDRKLFNQKVAEAGLKVAKSIIATNKEEALSAANTIGYPIMLRVAYALGGLGSGIVQNDAELTRRCERAFSFAGQVLIEESLYGWKELEYEIVRDKYNNCITICSMENIDPMGIHTGDSVVVAPQQTLTANENFMLRSIGIKMIRHLGIVGECNIQFALNPLTGDYRIIEVNARLSRSSALASKATGYPLAFVATKLSLGYGLNEILNNVTQETSSCFEPALDYIVIKFPRWDLQKFDKVSTRLGSEMKSVGEVMAIGRTFEEAFQKSIRMLDIGLPGFSSLYSTISDEELVFELQHPSDKRLFYIAEALMRGFKCNKINKLTHVSEWFISKMENIISVTKILQNLMFKEVSTDIIILAKKYGFSDKQIAELTESNELQIRDLRYSYNILPYSKQIDTLAAEFPAKTNYLYTTYSAQVHDIQERKGKQIIVIGSGPYRIGSSVEFDWCCVSAVQTIRKLGYKAIMINCNPETVSTDHDICDKLYFEELTLERVLDICHIENPMGVIVSVGGQTPNNLSKKLSECGVKILGTSTEMIDNAENRHKFSAILDRIGCDQPAWKESTTLTDAKIFANTVGYPVLIRPSYVLSGAAMSIVLNDEELEVFLEKASIISPDYPVVMSKFITNAREIEIDAVAESGKIFCYAISEHVENAGVHSGDATLVLPPQRTYLETIRRIKHISRDIAKTLEITGPFNMQFIAKDNDVKVIECNLRASRSFPFVSKVLNINFIDIAIRLMLKEKVPAIDRSYFDLDFVAVKAPQFSFTRLKGSDPILGVEMTSTGEVACIGSDFNEAFLKSFISTGYRIPRTGIFLSTGTTREKTEIIDELKSISLEGVALFGTKGTADFYKQFGLNVKPLFRPYDNQEPAVLTAISEGQFDLVINIPKTNEKEELDSDYIIRRHAIDSNIPLITNIHVAKRFLQSAVKYFDTPLPVKCRGEYV